MTPPFRTSLAYVALILANTLVLFPLVTLPAQDSLGLAFVSMAGAVGTSLALAKRPRFLWRSRLVYALALVAAVAVIGTLQHYTAKAFLIHLVSVMTFFVIGVALLRPRITGPQRSS
jgi:uncharacterized membrane protein YfcA